MLKKLKSSGVGYVFPAVVIVAIVMCYPLIYTFVMGFFENTLFTEKPVFCGLKQYQVLFTDETFIGSVYAGVRYGAASTSEFCKRENNHSDSFDDSLGNAEYYRFRGMEVDVQRGLWNY